MKPILFNTAMVQAILEGRKTTTRRIAKGLKDATKVTNGDFKWDYKQSWMNDLGLEIHAPYHIGDILYVRETWKSKLYADGYVDAEILYKSDDSKCYLKHISDELFSKLLKFSNKNGWQPSLFMPREAARIFLRVKNVKIERLQDITEEGTVNEGIGHYGKWKLAFEKLWDSTVNKKDLDKYGWNANPWVWVIEFERCEKPNEI